MPLTKSSKPSAIGQNIREFHHGKTYAKTASKFGKERADKQAIAVAFSVGRQAKNRADGGMIPYQPMGGTPSTTFLGGLGANQPGLAGAPMPPVGVAGPMPAPMMPNPMQAGAPQVPMPPRAMNTGGRAFGGASPAHPGNNPSISMTRGPILSAVPGRTDAHATHVPSGAYVIPADIVSGHGEGNTIAGAHALQRMFKMGPHAPGYPRIAHGRGAPALARNSTPYRVPTFKAPPMPKFNPKGLHSGGGKGGDDHMGHPVRVNLAGGEIVVPPEHLKAVVHHDLKRAHEIMDAWVINERKKLRKTLAKLPGPAKD